MTFDAFLSATAEIFVTALSPVERQAFYRALTILLQDPYPDGASKFRLELVSKEPNLAESNYEHHVSRLDTLEA